MNLILKTYFKLSILLLISLGEGSAWSKTIELPAQEDSKQINHYFEILRDTTSTLKLNDVMERTFAPSHGLVDLSLIHI